MAERWYVAQVKTGREEVAAINLRRQQFEVFLPRSLRTIRHARKITTARTSFFPGYLFVRMDVDRARWRSIDGTMAVLRLLKANEAPLAAPLGLVETLVSVSSADGLLDLAGVLAPGACVRVIGGPFADQLATVEAMNGPDRVRVLLSVMNQTVPVDVERMALAAI